MNELEKTKAYFNLNDRRVIKIPLGVWLAFLLILIIGFIVLHSYIMWN